MLRELEQIDLQPAGGQNREERGDRSVARTLRDLDDVALTQLDLEVHAIALVRGDGGDQLEAAPPLSVGAGLRGRQVLVAENVPDLLAGELATLCIGPGLHDTAELDLQTTRQFQGVVVLQQVGDSALARLRVDADDGLIAAAEVLRVDGQVRHGPLQLVDRDAALCGIRGHLLEALLDGVLVRTAECGVDQISHPRVALRHRQLVAVLDRALDHVDVGEVDLRVDALREQVDAQCDQVDIARALAIAEQAALDAVGAGQVAELGCGDGGSAVVVRVQAEDHVLAVGEPAAHPLDRVSVDVGSGHLDGGRQVDDDLALRRRLEDLDHLVADVECELELRAGVALRRVLVVHLGAGNERLHLAALARAVQGDVDDALLVLAEHDLALQHAGGVVQVHDGLLGALDRLVGALDQVVAGLRQHLDGDVVGDRVLFDQAAHEVEVGLACAREADLDLLVAHADQQVEHDALALRAHRIDQCLVAVAQVNGTPAGCLGDALARPGAIGQFDGDLLVERTVTVDRHCGCFLVVLHGVSISSRVVVSQRQTPRRERPEIRTRRGS